MVSVCNSNADWVTDLIHREKNGDGTVWLTGFSGGAEEISYFLLPILKETEVTDGGAIMFGGGGSPKKEGLLSKLPKNSTVRGDFPLTCVVGENDTGWDDDGFDAVTATKEGEAFYRSQGWDTKRTVVKGKSHVLNNGGVGMYGSYIGKIMK